MKWISLLMIAVMGLSSCEHAPTRNLKEGLRIAMDDDPTSMDPRTGRMLNDATVAYLLYDGLLRVNFRGEPKPAIAERFEQSKDGMTYTFHLREAKWANGDLVKAQDFMETWKNQLRPDFVAPNAFQLFVIRNAKAAKQGTVGIDLVGIETPNDYTLVVHLEEPTPYFPKLVASYFYFPVHSSIRDGSVAGPIGNGPYELKSWQRKDQVVVAKNEQYWDAKHVKMPEIALVVASEKTALQLYEKGELDWAGSPMGALPVDSLSMLSSKGDLRSKASAGVHWIRVNTTKPVLTNKNFRQALNLAIDRQAIVDHVLLGDQQATYGIVPPQMLPSASTKLPKTDSSEAWQNFQIGLEESKVSLEELPTITLSYANNAERNHKVAQAIQQQWQESLGIQVNLESLEAKVLNQKLKSLDYDMALGSWYGDIDDPINFLQVFERKDNGTNNTGWDNPEYGRLLSLSNTSENAKDRAIMLSNAEAILINDAPVLPIWVNTFNYVKNAEVTGVRFSDLGYLDFKYAGYSTPTTDEIRGNLQDAIDY